MKKIFGRNKQYEEDMEYYEEEGYSGEEFSEEESYDASEADTESEEFYEGAYEASEEEIYEASEEVFEEEIYEASEEEVFEEEVYEASEEEVFEEGVYEASEEEVFEEEVYEASGEEVFEEEVYEASEEVFEEEVYEASGEEVFEEEYIEDLAEEEVYYEEDEEEEILAWSAMPDKNIFQKIWYSMIHMSTMDRVITTTGVLVLVLALATGAVFASAQMLNTEVASFDTVGAQLDGITVIGEHGLTAVADAELAKLQAAGAIAEEEDRENEEYEENEYKREVEVTLNMTSIEKDLKLKFVNRATNKLIANVPFSVTVKTPDGKTETWTDDDMDGIIYKTGITPGEYSVAMNALTDSKYAGFSISTSSKKVTVYKEIQYKKVDVSDEIKNESELNQKEDAENELEIESELVDTVAWVESTVTPGKVVWTEIPKANLNVDIPLTASAKGMIMKMSGGGISLIDDPLEDPVSPPPEETTDPTPDPTPDTSGGDSGSTVPVTGITLEPQELSLTVGGGASLTATVSPGNATNKDVTWKSDNEAVAKVEGGKVTAIAEGTAIITATAGEHSATCKVTVKEASITLAPTSMSIVAGGTGSVTVTITGGSLDGSITASSNAENIATVSPKTASGTSATLTITGHAAGTATITVTYQDTQDSAPKSASLTVTVLGSENKLVDKSGNQIWKKVSEDNYVEATYADYADKSITVFYLKTETEPRYTGWQSIGGKMYYFDANGNKVTGEQVIQGAKYNFASDGSLVVGSGSFGIDVSKWNGYIDWNGVKNSGVSYVIIRCGYRGYGSGALVVDPYFEQNIKGATAAGIKVGVYFFSQAVNRAEAVEEASMVLQLVKGYTISYPVFLDVEYSGAAGNTGRADSLNVATRTEVVKAFCETIQNSGYTAGVYANKSWLTSMIDTSQLTRYKIWLAQYAAAPSYTGRYDLWQYKSNGRITGINGDVDLNLSYLGY